MKLQLESVTKTYSDAVAVNRVSLAVREGEFMTLLGPSGSGKTTTLMVVAGFTAPDSGRVLLDGHDVTRLPAFKRGIGVVFQNYALFPHLTVHENIAFPLRMRATPRAEMATRVAQVLELVGLPQCGPRYPRQLSGGQQQRIALARALVFNPPLLIMDEPLGALDRKLREQMQLEIKRIQRDLNVTVVYVTHDQEEALVMSDRIALMRQGQIEQIGSARELYERPASRFVAHFIGETNLFEGELIESRDDCVVVRVDRDVTMRARGITGPNSGSRVSIAVRPETLRFSTEADPREENFCNGVIVDEVYVGDSIKYRVRVAEGLEFILRCQNQGRIRGARGCRRGDAVGVAWPIRETSVFAAAGSE